MMPTYGKHSSGEIKSRSTTRTLREKEASARRRALGFHTPVHLHQILGIE